MYSVEKSTENEQQGESLGFGNLEECRAYQKGYVRATENYLGYEVVFREETFPFGTILRSPLVSAPELIIWIDKSVEITQCSCPDPSDCQCVGVM